MILVKDNYSCEKNTQIKVIPVFSGGDLSGPITSDWVVIVMLAIAISYDCDCDCCDCDACVSLCFSL